MRLWHCEEGTRPVRILANGAIGVSTTGVTPLGAPGSGRREQLVVLPVAESVGTVATVLVPNRLAHKAAVHGRTLAAGAHSLKHGDRLDLGRQRLWVAADEQPSRS